MFWNYRFLDEELFYATTAGYCVLYIAIRLESYTFPQDTVKHGLYHEAVIIVLGAALVMAFFQVHMWAKARAAARQEERAK